MTIPSRVKGSAGRHALVDGIPFQLPVNMTDTPALFAAFTIDADRAAEFLPGNELHPIRLPGGRGLLIITVIDYKVTDIGKYIEYSIAIGCTHGPQPRNPLLALLRGKAGQFVVELPVSSEISVKGGKGIWGMPKYQAYCEFSDDGSKVASRYFLDGEVAVNVEIDRPRFNGIPVAAGASNYCTFRGMLMKSDVYFRGRMGINVPFTSSGRIEISDHPRVAPLKTLDIAHKPLFTAYLANMNGVLDDHVEAWFISYEQPPATAPPGLETVIDLGLSQEWLESPTPDREERTA